MSATKCTGWQVMAALKLNLLSTVRFRMMKEESSHELYLHMNGD